MRFGGKMLLRGFGPMRFVLSAVVVLALWTACGSTSSTGTKTQQANNANHPVGNADQQKPGSGITVTYIANEGVLISSSQKQVLIDGLHREYKPAYAFPPPELRESLE